MTATAGILFTEALGIGGKWYEAGSSANGEIPVLALIAIQLPVMGFFEMKRLNGFLQTGTSGVLNTFPWDPAAMSSDAMRLKEIKNGRLAMISFVGYCVQALVCQEGPLGCLNTHISNPFGSQIFSNIATIQTRL